MIHKTLNIKSDSIESLPIKYGTYSIKDYAYAFITGMDKVQCMRFKKMLENGIECGKSVSESYGVDYDDFIKEVKKQLEVD